MNIHRIAPVLLLGACLFFPPPLHAEDGVRSEAPPTGVPSLDSTIDLLLSPSKADQQQGEELAARHATDYRDLIISGLKDPAMRAAASFQLRVLVSPWQRGIAAGQRHKGSMTLPLPRRPVDRPLDGPHHATCREALLEALRATAAAPEDDERRHTLESVCEALTEIGDGAAIVEMARLLENTDDPEVGRPILESLCRRMGFHHPDVPLGMMCGALDFAEMKSRGRRAGDPHSRYITERDAFLGWFKSGDREIPNQQQLMRQALDRLDRRMRVPEFVHLGYDEGVGDLRKLEPLIRFGAPILPLLRTRQAAEDDLSKRGNHELIAAAITGRIDPGLMGQLLASDHRDCGLACGIVRAAGSREWTKQIAKLQFREGFDHKVASEALACILRKEALPQLHEALKSDPENHSARYAIAELKKWPE